MHNLTNCPSSGSRRSGSCSPKGTTHTYRVINECKAEGADGMTPYKMAYYDEYKQTCN